ncbi:mucin-1 [Empidonax traillii]|uniref:mucin-1 n=1 Tax=Empidonax traillii TaxID=164674 RepID=UPI000FFD63F7|nr:mucin-1 [Empidonax traillii]
MAFTALLLLLVLGTGTRAMPMETTAEMETTETAATEMTTETTPSTLTVAPPVFPKSTGGSRPSPSLFPHATMFPGKNTTDLQSGNHSLGNGTAVPVPGSPAISHPNATSNSSSWAPHLGTNSSSASPTTVDGGNSSAKGNGSTSAQAPPTRTTSVTAEGSTAHGQTPTGEGPNPSKATAQLPAAAQLLARVPLSFRIINRSFNESLRDPTSEQYRSLSRTVLAVFEHVFGCAGCMGTQTYMGCSELRYSQGSVEVQSTLVFGNGSNAVTASAAEQRLRKSLDQNGFIMGLQLDSIQGSSEVVMSPAPVPMVPDWAIALLVLVSILLLLSFFTCLLLMSSCTCRRKSRGKLDLLSQKDSYHPMAEYLQYQSHGRYVAPNSKPNPYSQVAGSSTTRAGTFTYTNPSAGSDNL